jgi:excisionase family DNA binding protein
MPNEEIPPPIVQAAISILSPYVPGLTPEKLQSLVFIETDPSTGPEELLTRKEAAERLHISIPTIDRMLRDRELSRRHIRGAVRIPLSEIETIMHGGR